MENLLGLAPAVIGAGLAAGLGGMGSSLGVGTAGQTGAGVITDKPELFGKVLLLQALPGTQGIYGFLGALLIMLKIGLLGGAPLVLDAATSWQFFAAGIPVGLSCLLSGWYQGTVSAAAINAIAKDDSNLGKGIILAAMVETYAVLGLLVSVLMIFSIALPAAA